MMYEMYPAFCQCGCELFYMPRQENRDIVTTGQRLFCFNPHCDIPSIQASKTHDKKNISDLYSKEETK